MSDRPAPPILTFDRWLACSVVCVMLLCSVVFGCVCFPLGFVLGSALHCVGLYRFMGALRRLMLSTSCGVVCATVPLCLCVVGCAEG